MLERRYLLHIGLAATAFSSVAADEECYSKQSIANIVVGSIFATFAGMVLLMVIAAVVYWRFKLKDDEEEDDRKRRLDKVQAQQPMQKRDISKGSAPVGHLNPAYNTDTTDNSEFPGYMPCKEFEPRPKASVRSDDRKSRTLDDSVKLENRRVKVQLTSTDAMGLGFNISGGLRDGIYVHQIHKRGPASESPVMSVGDRVMSVTINFEKMVFEDAFTILSYASPYTVGLELDQSPATPPSTTPSTRHTILQRSSSAGEQQLMRHHRLLHTTASPDQIIAHPCMHAGETKTEKSQSLELLSLAEGAAESQTTTDQVAAAAVEKLDEVVRAEGSDGEPVNYGVLEVSYDGDEAGISISGQDSGQHSAASPDSPSGGEDSGQHSTASPHSGQHSTASPHSGQHSTPSPRDVESPSSLPDDLTEVRVECAPQETTSNEVILTLPDAALA